MTALVLALALAQPAPAPVCSQEAADDALARRVLEIAPTPTPPPAEAHARATRDALGACMAAAGLTAPPKVDRALVEHLAPASLHEFMVQGLLDDPGSVLVVLSAALCVHEDAARAARAEMRTEMRYAKEAGGVVNGLRLNAAKDAARRGDEGAARARAALKRARARATPCSEPRVARLAACLADVSCDLRPVFTRAAEILAE